ncbi:TetR/AcrR family transcriptional regulator [Nocardia carnea]|uniref:TetR/AcrR family transcriptional regulator n=1 Tax=Nocardia carnea TaxID=37328 RepID=UPI002456A37E|nr:TetR family transcriptional regulator [Nocardia carnea]
MVSGSGGSRERGKTGARRSQIIEATIETLAEHGFAQTTFARIRARGELSSTRLISYHFASKAHLIQAVLDYIYQSIDDFLLTRTAVDPASRPIRGPLEGPPPPPADSAAAELRAYINGVVAYVGDHRARMRALQTIFAALHDEPDEPLVSQTDPAGTVMGYLIALLERGQRSGEFRTFNPLVLGTMIQSSLAALPDILTHQPRLDLPAFARELTAAVELATREVGAGQEHSGR